MKLVMIRLPVWRARAMKDGEEVVCAVHAATRASAVLLMESEGFETREVPYRVHNPDRKSRKQRLEEMDTRI